MSCNGLCCKGPCEEAAGCACSAAGTQEQGYALNKALALASTYKRALERIAGRSPNAVEIARGVLGWNHTHE